MIDDRDVVRFDEEIELALALSAGGAEPRAHVRLQTMERVKATTDPVGFAFKWIDDDRWLPHPVPGIKMKILALNKERGYATLLLDVAPGTHFPPHHHGGAEECYIVSGTVTTCGRELRAGDFVHADAGTDHGELFTETGCRVILVVPPEEHLPESLLR
ncbi:MAG TPA: cupin domain-containing protein [Vicinamibacterales bacterium]|jgi:anti-sigma factor ChrR (cupin superfamily)|nr:cupin domain-containing protein [Vicinamibacterales bacterium]